MSRYNTFWFGMLMALICPAVGFGAIYILIELLLSIGILDIRFISADFYTRTLPLIALCLNAVCMQYFFKRRWDHAMRGMILPTLLLAGIWVYQNRGLLETLGF